MLAAKPFSEDVGALSEKSQGGVIGDEPTPEFAALVTEQYQALLGHLPDDMCRDIVQWKLEGHTDQQIARRLNCSRSTIQRRLRMVRSIWSQEGQPDQ